MGQQLALFEESVMAAEKKTRFTLKAKKQALNDIYQQMTQGWDPNEGMERLIEWLRSEIASAEKDE